MKQKTDLKLNTTGMEYKPPLIVAIMFTLVSIILILAFISPYFVEPDHKTAYDVKGAVIEYKGEYIEANGKVTYNVPHDTYFFENDYCDNYFFVDGTRDYVVHVCSVEEERIENGSLYLKVGDGFLKNDDGKVTTFW